MTGTAAISPEGSIVGEGDAYLQAKRCFEIIEECLHILGSDKKQIVRTRMFVTDITRWSEYGKAHSELFCEHPPATTMVEVSRLIDPRMLIEIEADAVCSTSRTKEV